MRNQSPPWFPHRCHGGHNSSSLRWSLLSLNESVFAGQLEQSLAPSMCCRQLSFSETDSARQVRRLLNKQQHGTLMPKGHPAVLKDSFNNPVASRALPIKGVHPGSSSSSALVEKPRRFRVISVTTQHQGRKQGREHPIW